jgi:hypothetical protein
VGSRVAVASCAWAEPERGPPESVVELTAGRALILYTYLNSESSLLSQARPTLVCWDGLGWPVLPARRPPSAAVSSTADSGGPRPAAPAPLRNGDWASHLSHNRAGHGPLQGPAESQRLSSSRRVSLSQASRGPQRER